MLISVASYCAGEGTEAYPSITRIAADCGISPTKVPSSISRLGAYIQKTRGERGRANGYRLIVHKVFPPKEVPRAAMGHCHPRQDATAAGGNQTDQGTDQRTPPVGREHLRAFDGYQPRLEVVAWAHEKGIEDFDDVLEDWKDWLRGEGKAFPADPDASLRRWVRKEKRIRESSRKRCRKAKVIGSSAPPCARSTLIETALDEIKKGWAK